MIFQNWRKKIAVTKELIALMEEKAKLDIELKNVQQNIAHETRKKEMAIAESAHAHKIEMEKREKDHEIKHRETISLMRLEAEQKIKQAELDAQRVQSTLIAKHTTDVAEIESRLMKEHYEKLQTALEELHSKGNITTQFMKELALKLLDQSPKISKQRLSIRAPKVT